MAENARFVASTYGTDDMIDDPAAREGHLAHARDMDRLAEYLRQLYKRETGKDLPAFIPAAIAQETGSSEG